MLEEVREQEEGVRFLRRAVEKKLTSPLLLVGDEGVGRRFSVQLAVRMMFCTGTRTIACTCVDCLQVRQGTHPDFSILAPIEDRDIGVDAIRGLITESCAYPAMAPLRIFLIDGADRLTAAAANAFLKTLEEPPERVRFFLLAENSDKVIATIRSRCGMIRYRRLSEAFVQSVVQRYEGDLAKALVYTRMGEGSMGRSIRLCGAGRLTLRDKVVDLVRTCLAKDLARSFSMVELLEKDLPLALRFLGQITHDVLMLPYDSSRLINQDIVETLELFRGQAPSQVWQDLRSKLHGILARSQVTPVNLPFHLKTLFVEVFGV
jgi:DNA polymerase-3 subunit delta'